VADGGRSSPGCLPRLGFLGVGWIGRSRMEAVLRAGAASAGAVADADPAAAQAAAEGAAGPRPKVCRDLDELLAEPLDGVVIATPTALHAEQASRVLAAGLPVFCQKPLGRTEAECSKLVRMAGERDLRLGVDMSYRHLAAVAAVRARLFAGDIGSPRAVELTFHNAYGPARGWASQVALAGGGALVDLGCHLIDLAALLVGPLRPLTVHADLFAGARRLPPDPGEVEDLALAQLTLEGGASVRVACSWWHPAGRDAVIEATVIGERGALRVANVGGSFYDFEAVRLAGAQREQLLGPPDDWGGRALTDWARALAAGHGGFDPEVGSLVAVARVIDMIYGRGARRGATRERAAAGDGVQT
jgi:predicted dehydrogenase